MRICRAQPATLAQIIRDQAANLKNPPLSVNDVLDTLAQHVPLVVDLLRAEMISSEGDP